MKKNFDTINFRRREINKGLYSILILFFFISFSVNLKSSSSQEIFSAIKVNDLTKVKYLLKNNASIVNQKDSENNTPLHKAASSGQVDIVKLLLKNKADIDAVNVRLYTPLHEAIINGKDSVSKVLIKKGSNLTKQDVLGRTPLHLAARYNSLAIAELLISKGVDLDSRDNHQRTPLLLLTLMTKNVEMARLLIQKGANINAREAFENMPLNQVAYYSNSLELINLLIDHKADFNTKRNGAKNMLSSAANLGSVNLFNYIVKKDIESLFKNVPWNNYLMRCALNGGSIEIVKMLQKRNISVNVQANIYGWTPLHHAANNNKPDMIKFLLKNGADINKRTNSGESAYNLAEKKGEKDILKLIIQLGGNSEPQIFPILTGPFFGQIPPKNKPTIFAPGIISSEHSSVTFSPDGREIYWQANSLIMKTQQQNGQWTKPELVSFSRDKNFRDDVPFVSPDNRKLFFTSQRPLGSSLTKKENIWYVERTSSGWSKPKPVSAKVNGMSLHWQISVSNSGTLYYAGKRGEDGFGSSDIYYSKIENSEYTNPVNIGPIINTKDGESSPFIAPDESYIIFSKSVSGRGKLHISFKSKDGQWQQPISIISDTENAICPVISPDGKYLFYLEYDSIKWVSAKFIKELKPKNI